VNLVASWDKKIKLMTENEIAKEVVDCCFKVHSALGAGLFESVYEAALAFEFDKRGIEYTRQESIEVYYEDELLDVGFRADFIIENKFIIELKSVEQLEKVHHKQILTYLKVTGMKLGLLVNFNVDLIKEGIHRKINGQLS